MIESYVGNYVAFKEFGTTKITSKESGDEDDFLSDKLSDEYDFCVNSFEYKLVEED